VQVCSYRFDEEDDSLVLKAQSEKQMLEISVPLPKIFRFIDSMGLNDKIFDEELYAIKYRHHIIPRVIANYIKRFI
jgi:hypothetical protein